MNKKLLLKIIGCIVFSLLGAFIFFVYAALAAGFSSQELMSSSFLVNVFTFLSIQRFIFIWVCFILIFYCVLFIPKKSSKFLFTYRYYIALAVIVLGVVFKINGSSIGTWALYFPGATESGVLLGMSRPIRSDEWAVITPFALSQYQTGFSYLNELVRGASTDVFAITEMPVLNLLVIFKPFLSGYLFMGPEYGMSFYWMTRFVGLALVTFELGRILTNDNRKLSVALMFLVTLSPVVQWWFSPTFLPETLIFGELIVIIVNKFMCTQSQKVRWLMGAAFWYAGCAYILNVYPSWQIPFFYVFAALAIWVIVKNWLTARLTWKNTLPIILVSIVFMGLTGVYFYMMSKSAIEAISGTVYPGERIFTGGDGFSTLFYYPGNLFFTFKDVSVLNRPELSTFYSFFPLSFIFSIYVLCKDKKKDLLSYILLGVGTFFVVYISIGIPQFLAKLTLFSNVQASRAVTAFSYLSILMLLRSMAIMKSRIKWLPALIVSFAVSMGVCWLSKALVYGDYLGNYLFLAAVLILSAVSFTALMFANGKIWQNCFTTAVIVLSVFTCLLVNPIRTGLSGVYDNTLGKEIEAIAKTDDSAWIAEDQLFTNTNFFPVFGARTINTTAVYPDLETWYKIDPTHQYEDVYNRYAHFTVAVQNTKPTEFILLGQDNILVDLNVDDLSKLGVGYIYSQNDLSQFSNDTVTFEAIRDNTDGLGYIYRVIYF